MILGLKGLSVNDSKTLKSCDFSALVHSRVFAASVAVVWTSFPCVDGKRSLGFRCQNAVFQFIGHSVVDGASDVHQSPGEWVAHN